MHILKENIEKQGFAFLHQYCPEQDTTTIANAIGLPLTPWEGGLIQELTPRAASTPNTYSGIYGLKQFPFHTDLAHWPLPPRYLLLRCMKGYADVPTLLLDAEIIFDAAMRDILGRAIFRPRRPREGELALLHLLASTTTGDCFRWDEVFLRPASVIGEVAAKKVQDRLTQCQFTSISLAHAGDTLLIDNWRMLHARSSILTGREDRRIQRIYLESLH